MRYFIYFLFSVTLFNIYCNAQDNKNTGLFHISDTIDYSKLIRYDRNDFQLVKNGENPQSEIVLKNMNNCQISFSSHVFCSDTIIFSFYGTILDIKGNPIKNVKIELLNQRNGTNYTSFSDSTGRYSIDAVIGTYTFQVSRQGFYSFLMNNFNPICDEFRNVNIILQEFQE